MNAIRFLATCQAAGEHREAGAVYTVPGQIPANEAEYLVRIGRAETHEVSVAKPRKKAKAE